MRAICDDRDPNRVVERVLHIVVLEELAVPPRGESTPTTDEIVIAKGEEDEQRDRCVEEEVHQPGVEVERPLGASAEFLCARHYNVLPPLRKYTNAEANMTAITSSTFAAPES